MKRKSTKLLVTMLGIILTLLIIMQLQCTTQIQNVSNGIIIDSEDAKDFRHIKVSGRIWELTIIQRKDFGLELDYDPKLKKFLSVTLEERNVNNAVLKFELNGRYNYWQTAYATVYMPSLTNIQISGASKVKFSGFTESDIVVKVSGASELETSNTTIKNNLEFQASGASDINLRNLKVANAQISLSGASELTADGIIKNLILEATGASEIDLADALTTNAEISLTGASDTHLQMAGGILSGRLSGASELSYKGNISENNIRSISGASKVEYLD